jgi:hypothetical protein
VRLENETTGQAWKPAIPFTPSHVSVNRVRVVDLPGVEIDPEVRGRLAYHLVSAAAVTAYAHERAEELSLPPPYLAASYQTLQDLPRYVDAALSSADPTRRSAAEAIAWRLGRNLGHILLTLHRGDTVNRIAREDWSDTDWAGWATIRQVWLAGGLLGGELGRRMVAIAQEWLSEAGYPGQPQVQIDPLRQELVLHGAARYLPPGSGYGLCLDFGQTVVKRAVFAVEEEGARLELRLPPVDTGHRWHAEPAGDAANRGRSMRDFVAGIVADSWEMACSTGAKPATDIVMSVAAYVEGGRLLGNGPYTAIHVLGNDARTVLSETVAARVGQEVRVHPIHDGTAAAAMHAGETDTAVLVAGTALGIGFPPAGDDGLLRIRPDNP